MKLIHPRAIASILAAALPLGCDNDTNQNPAAQDVTVKVAPADPGNAPHPANTPATNAAPPAAPSAPGESGAAGNSGGERQSAGGVSWELPAGWQRGPDRQMRDATLTDGAVDIAISGFPGDVGGTLLNINRWRGQVGLPPLASEAEADKALTEVDANGLKIRTLDLKGQQRMLVAIVPGKDKLHFFKMSGDSDAIGKRQQAFMAVVKSIRLE